ncbi:DNA-processing protein DprA [Bacillus cereus]
MSTLWLALSSVKGLGTKTLKKLYYEVNDNLSLEFLTDKRNFTLINNVIKNSAIVANITDKEFITEKMLWANYLISKHNKEGISIITIDSPKYPKLLRLIEDPPVALYCKGNIDLLSCPKNVAIIGTRKPTPLGMRIAKRIASRFSERGFVIVSGLAVGIDTAGHQGALEVNGPTIAVLAGSLDKIYPKENTDLAQQIIEKNGLLISENPIGSKTFKQSFVVRDRLQSGLSLGVCPVQTPLKSGTQHTIKFAKQQNRVLFCPEPLEPYEEAVQGIHELLNSKVAEKISGEQDYERICSLMFERYEILISAEEEQKNKLSKGSKTIVNASKQQDFNLFSYEEFDEVQHLKESLDLKLNEVIEISKKLGYSPQQLINKIEEVFKNRLMI